jgi:hypothetical protein
MDNKTKTKTKTKKTIKPTEEELIEMECPTDSEEPLEVSIEYDLKI